MIFQTIAHVPAFKDSHLESYIHQPHSELQITKRKAIIVCPGGGYGSLSNREGEPVALQYFAAGLNAFVLRYSLGAKAADHAPLIEACLAVKYLRDHAEELYIDPDYVFITGFSAGGHLAAWCGTMWHAPEVAAHLNGADQTLCKPTATLLCYPVITNHPKYRHIHSLITLNGGSKDEEGLSRFSLDDLVDERTAPAFLWHTSSDPGVSVQNSLLYAAKLAAYKIPFELHVFPVGGHGISLADKETGGRTNPTHYVPYVTVWIKLALRWIEECPFR